MSEKRKTVGLQGGYQAKIDKPLKNPPKGGSNVQPPPSNSSKKDT